MNQKEELELFLKELIGAAEDDNLPKDKKEKKLKKLRKKKCPELNKILTILKGGLH